MKYLKTYEEKKENIGNFIFLDIDGVLIPYDVHEQKVHEFFNKDYKWKEKSIDLLNKLIDEMDAKIVLTSSYRKKYSKEEINKRLKKEGFEYEIFDFAPAIKDKDRCFEITDWIDKHKIDKFIILDDVENENIGDKYSDNFVMCKHKKGFTKKKYKEAKKLYDKQ